MENIMYKNICDKLGIDLKNEAIPIIAEEYDGEDILDKLTVEELDYLSTLDFIKYKPANL